MAVYTNWKVGNLLYIGVNVAEYCGQTPQFIYIYSYDIQMNPLTLTCPITGCNAGLCINTSGKTVNFFSCKNYSRQLNDINCNNVSYTKYYRQLNSMPADANGNAAFTYTVTSLDLSDYNDATSDGGTYNIIACISDPKATNAHAINFGNIIITDPCASVICNPNYICQGCLAYDAICDPNNPTGPCIQGTRNPTKDFNCAFGNLSITSTPQGATILIDNVSYGQTGASPQVIPVSTGTTHTLKLSLIGYNDFINANISVNCGSTLPIDATLTPLSGTPTYELALIPSPDTNPNYIIGILDKFVGSFIDTLLGYVSGITVTGYNYDSTNNQILIDMQQTSSLVAYSLSRISRSSSDSDQSSSDSPYVISTLDILSILSNFFFIFQPLSAFLFGFSIWNWLFGTKAAAPSYTTVTINVLVNQGGFPTIPARVATVVFNGQTKQTTILNNTVVFNNVKTNNQYGIDAYIPISSDSNSRYATLKKGFQVQVSIDPVIVTLNLDINVTTQRDYQLCNIPKVDGSPAPNGTKIRLYSPQDVIVTTATGTNLVSEALELGTVTIQSTNCPTNCTTYANAKYAQTPIFNCTNSIKIEGYIPDNKILYSIATASVDPNQPDPVLQSYLNLVYKTYNETKNTITVFVNTITKDPLVADTINIKDSNGTIIKTVTPNAYVCAIDGIPSGTYTVEVIKSGYKFSSCTPGCNVLFESDILGAASVYVIMQSLVTTCQAQVYVLDNNGKHLTTTAFVALDGAKTSYQVLPSDGYTMITGITVGDHKFTINADGYQTVTDFAYTVACKTETEVISIPMKLSGGGPDLQTTLSMTVNGSAGSINVDKNKPLDIKITGGTPSAQVSIYDTSTTPDTILNQGNTDTTGTYTTTLQFNSDSTVPIQAFQGCVGKCPGALCICSSASNIVTLTVGAGAKECAIPNPLGGCLLYKSTATNIALMMGLGLVGIIGLGIFLSRQPTGPTIREIVPTETGTTIIREEKPPTVLGAAISGLAKTGVE